jgi:transposase
MLDTIFVGMDVYKATISVAVGDGARGGEVRQLGNFLNRADHVDKLVQRLSKTDGRRLRFCHECAVVAPSLIPMKAGDRIKTDRRDAVMLAKLHRAGNALRRRAYALMAVSPARARHF